jgi:hypothetical protein
MVITAQYSTTQWLAGQDQACHEFVFKLSVLQVDAGGNKFQSVADLIASEKAARAARRGGAEVATSEEETVSDLTAHCDHCSLLTAFIHGLTYSCSKS